MTARKLTTETVFDQGRESLSPEYQVRYDFILEQLLGDAENKIGFGFLEKLMCERLALLHCWGLEMAKKGIGGNEADPTAEQGFADVKEYQDFQNMWFGNAARLQRAQALTVDASRRVTAERDRIFDEFTKLVAVVIHDDAFTFDAKTTDRLRDMFAEGVDLIFHGKE